MAAVTTTIDPRAYELGVRFAVITIAGVAIGPSSKPVQKHCRTVRRGIGEIDVEGDVILGAYRRCLSSVGASDAVSSPEWLADTFTTQGKLPSICNVVDLYNHDSLKHRCVLSAHDLDKLAGDVRLEVLDAPRPFEPLGRPDEVIPAGEWGVADDAHMLCRLNCKQSRLSSISPSTRNILIYAQGNPLLEGNDVRVVLDEVAHNIIRYCGGKLIGMAGEGVVA